MRPRFSTSLIVEFRQTGVKRVLCTDLRYYSRRIDALLRIPSGFETDFASVPRLPLAFLLAGDTGHYAAVVHDWLYSGRSDVAVSRRAADDVLLEALEVTGVAWWRRWPMWLAVRLFGGRCWRA